MNAMATSILDEVKRAIDAAPHGCKDAIKTQWAETLGMNPKTLDRKLRERFGRQRAVRADAGIRKSGHDLEAAVAAVWAVKAKLEKETARDLCTEDAIAYAEQLGEIPPGILDRSTANRIALKQGYSKARRANRIETRYANQVQLTDGSGSEHLGVAGTRADGEIMLAPRFTCEKAYKNIRIRPDIQPTESKFMLYYYAFVDDHSRLLHVEPYIANGEDATTHTEALQAAWASKSNNPMIGIPEIVYSDNGPLCRSLKGMCLFDDLGVKLVTHMPYNSRAKGKVERPWRTLFHRFETHFLLRKNELVTFTAFKQYLANYIAEYNRKISPSLLNHRGISREAMYIESITTHGYTPLPADIDLKLLLADPFDAVVDNSCCIRRDNVHFEIIDCPPTLIGRSVPARMNAYGGVTITNPLTGERMKTRTFAPLSYGSYRGNKHGVNEAASEAAALMHAPAALLFERPAAPAAQLPPNVVSLAARREEETFSKAQFKSPEEAIEFIVRATGTALPEFGPEKCEKIRQIAELYFGDTDKIEAAVTAINNHK